jgi:hypothetical protein
MASAAGVRAEANEGLFPCSSCGLHWWLPRTEAVAHVSCTERARGGTRLCIVMETMKAKEADKTSKVDKADESALSNIVVDVCAPSARGMGHHFAKTLCAKSSSVVLAVQQHDGTWVRAHDAFSQLIPHRRVALNFTTATMAPRILRAMANIVPVHSSTTDLPEVVELFDPFRNSHASVVTYLPKVLRIMVNHVMSRVLGADAACMVALRTVVPEIVA